ncbi:NAD(P)H quinone oxidoreductase, PIG3 family [Cellulomonas flavigena DSM 20109]|uniref:NAD(P)H quinone oxidoreductase, PIG3 family n=1 Tax=Cellulomonas flavigena (strain ATCC 482 / DSM 20109 / BCRC 11376 / JCM 18109 / NBRC 3775 / NCIMB 8073 / NRS 134) TaxID=446466 RepID=D5ULV2_CELFN|nr:NAD(P)H-quinone oxidoreductase [Cellulomonas flavigena]ADG76058.1 NAD(P)H quinone oxidoreductase, PIG3 family [Cellulomonas flavigena DSM 20109]
MRAVVVTSPGGPDVLRVQDVADPEPGVGEVLLDVVAAGVNRADLLQRAGHYPPPPGAPAWPGLEVSGVVAAMGPPAGPTVPGAGAPAPVPALRPGDRVAALLAGGGYAERVTVDVSLTLPVPPEGDVVDAAALPEALATVWSNLRAARLAPGETLLVQGGSGGVGSVAVQLAHALGHRVLATAGGPERCARVRALGADVVVDHRAQDVAQAVRDATDGRGVDVVLDVLGGPALRDNVRLLAEGGRLVVIGLQQGRRGELDLPSLMARRGSVIATTLRDRPGAQKAAIMADVREHVWPLVLDGRVRPVVHARMPLADAPRAHEALAAGEVLGKLLLLP